jgi:hypothetical protein
MPRASLDSASTFAGAIRKFRLRPYPDETEVKLPKQAILKSDALTSQIQAKHG